MKFGGDSDSQLVATRSRVARVAALVCLFAFVSATVGCGKGGPAGPHGKVRGKVTYQNKPITAGSVVSFISESGGTGASGSVKEDGSYELLSLNGNLIPAGKYKVLINPPPPPPMTPEEAMKASMNKDKPKPAEDPTIPKQYRTSLSTPERQEVKEGDNEINIELKDK
jgi:hypothetical protein